MTLRVHLLHPPDPEPFERLRFLLPEEVVLTHGEAVAPDAGVLVAGRPTREHLEASPDLEALVIPFAGMPEKTRDLLLDRPGLAVHNLHHNASLTAEMALGLLLAVAKSIVPIDRTFRRHDWRPRYRMDRSIDLAGRTAVVVGMGAVGRRITSACRGLGLKTIGVRRRAKGDDRSIEALPRLLARAEVLFLAVPDTPETRGMIGEAELALLPAGAIVVNVARGPVVEEAPLYRALVEGRLFGAGIDVWYRYPTGEEEREATPPSEFPFHELDNVVLSPHRAGHSGRTELLRAEHLAELLSEIAGGGEARHLVDPARGY